MFILMWFYKLFKACFLYRTNGSGLDFYSTYIKSEEFM